MIVLLRLAGATWERSVNGAGKNWNGGIGKALRGQEYGRLTMPTVTPITMPSLTAKFFVGLVIN